MTIVKIEKAKGTSKCVIKREIKSENYKNFLKETQPDKSNI